MKMKTWAIALILMISPVLVKATNCQVNESTITLNYGQSFEIKAEIPDKIYGEAYLWAIDENGSRWNYSFVDKDWTRIAGEPPIVQFTNYKGSYSLTTITANEMNVGRYEVRALVWDGWSVVDLIPYACNYTFIIR